MPHTLSDMLVVLRPERSASIDELRDRMRDRLAEVPGVSFLFTTPLGMRIDEGLGGTPADLSVRIFGPDLDELARLGAQAAAVMARVQGLTDVRVERLTGLPQLRITVDRAAAARVGLTPGDVIRAAAHRPGGTGGVGGLGGAAALRARGPPRGPLPRRPRRTSGACSSTGTTAPASRSASSRRSRRRSVPAASAARPAAGGSPSRRASRGATSWARRRRFGDGSPTSFVCRPATSSTSAAASRRRRAPRGRSCWPSESPCSPS